MTMETSITVAGLSADENQVANLLLVKLQGKAKRNLVRKTVYEGKRKVQQVSSILPPQYKGLALSVGWCAKAVDLLSLRCKLETFTWAGGDLDSLGFRNVWDGNMLDAEVGQGMDASLIHSTAFVTTTAGADASEPEVVWQFHDALKATGEWNARARRLDSLIVLTAWDDDDQLAGFVLYVPGETIDCRRVNGGWRVVDRQEHSWHVPADPLPYMARTGRPFGQSRITRPMLGLQNAAVRELMRLEGHMDTYSYPEFWMLGADPSIFTNADGLVQTAWEAMLGRIKGIPDDPNAPDPQTARAEVKQFPASSPEPHLAALNSYAKLFAREASLPDTSLAITDFANPTSGESYDASQYDLIAHAEGATDGWKPYLQRSMLRSLGMLNAVDGWENLPPEWLSLNAKFRDARYTSKAAQADAGMKQIAAIPGLAGLPIALELIGLDSDQRERAEAEMERAQAGSRLAQLIEAAQGVRAEPEGAVASEDALNEANVLKAKADALGVLRRAGVDAADAARLAGLSDVKFIPGQPITIKSTEE